MLCAGYCIGFKDLPWIILLFYYSINFGIDGKGEWSNISSHIFHDLENIQSKGS